MASYAFIDAYFTINSSNLSSYTKSVTFDAEADELDDTAMGDTWRSGIKGLYKGGVQVQFNDDVTASQLDSILWPLFVANAAHTFVVRATSSATSSSNPQWSGSILVNKHQFGGAVGDLGSKSLTFPTTTTITRQTT